MMTEQERELLAMVIGYRIRNQRKQQGISQQDLMLGFGSQSMLSLIESGHQLPLPDVLLMLGDRLHDDWLRQYGQLLESDASEATLHVHEHDTETLLAALASQRSHWPDAHARTATHLYEYYYSHGLIEKVQQLVTIIEKHPELPGMRSIVGYYRGSSMLLSGQAESAEVWLRQAEADLSPFTLTMRGRLFYNLGYMYQAIEIYGLALWYAKQAEKTFYELHDYERHAKALGLLGVVHCRLHRPEDALSSLILAYDILTKWGMSQIDRIRVELSLADVYSDLNLFEEADVWAQQARDSAIQVKDYTIATYASQILASTAQRREDLPTAAEHVKHALNAATQTQDARCMTLALLQATAVAENLQDKRQYAQAAYDLTKNTSFDQLHGLAAECLVTLCEAMNDKENVAFYLKAALRSYRTSMQKHAPFELFMPNLPLYVKL